MQKYLLLLVSLSGLVGSAAAQQAPAARPAALPVSHRLVVGQYKPVGLPGELPAPPALGVLPGSRADGRPRVPAGATAIATVAGLLLGDNPAWQRYQQQRAFTGRGTDPAGYLTGRPQ